MFEWYKYENSLLFITKLVGIQLKQCLEENIYVYMLLLEKKEHLKFMIKAATISNRGSMIRGDIIKETANKRNEIIKIRLKIIKWNKNKREWMTPKLIHWNKQYRR